MKFMKAILILATFVAHTPAARTESRPLVDRSQWEIKEEEDAVICRGVVSIEWRPFMDVLRTLGQRKAEHAAQEASKKSI